MDDCGGVYIAWRACIGCSNDAWHVSSHLSETGGDGGAKRTSIGCVVVGTCIGIVCVRAVNTVCGL